jgi:hypothetical protein
MWSANATNNFFILQNFTKCFGLYGQSSGDNYRNDIQYVLFGRFSFYCNTFIISMSMRPIYCNATGCTPQRYKFVSRNY